MLLVPQAIRAAEPLEGVDGRAEVVAIAARADRGTCRAADVTTLEAIEREAPPAAEVRGDLALVRAFVLQCLGRIPEAGDAARQAAAQAPIWRAVAWRYDRALPDDAASIPIWHLGPGGLDAWQRRGAVDAPERRAALLQTWATYAPTGALSADLESAQWALEPDPLLRAKARLRWLAAAERPDGQSEKLRALLQDAAGIALLRESPAALDVALEVAARAAWRGRADVAGSLSDAIVAIDAVDRGAASALREVWREVARLDGRRAGAARRELARLALRTDRAGVEASWALVRDARREDRDAAALDAALEQLAGARPGRRVDLLETCVHLAGAAGQVERQRSCWRQLRDNREFVPAALLRIMTVELAVDALVAGNAPAAEQVLALARGGDDAPELAYWHGRALEAVGEPERARPAYRAAIDAGPLGYYAWVSDGRLEALGEVAKHERRIRTLLEMPADPGLVDRAPAARLLALGLPRAARRWGAWGAQLTGAAVPDAVEAAARAHRAVGEDRVALWLLQRHAPVGAWSASQLGVASGDTLRAAWPTPFDKAFSPVEAPHIVAESVLRSFARRESSYDPNAVSGVDARGLLQVLPSTARGVARRADLERPTRRSLLDPYANVEIGAYALAEWFADPGPCLEPVAVAYAAGPARVRRWIARGAAGVDAATWLERMPYPTVRNYARDIVASRAVYAAILGEAAPSREACMVGGG